MTLFTAEGLLRSYYRGFHKGSAAYTGIVYHSYLRWLKTQGEASISRVFKHGTKDEDNGWLLRVEGIQAR